MNSISQGGLKAVKLRFAVSCGFWLLAAPVHAQPYALDWFTTDCGGGSSYGGIYSVSGTVGQPDAGRMTGGIYTLEGGFWGVVAGVVPLGPDLGVFVTDTNTVVVFWGAPANGWRLQVTTEIVPSGGVWIDIEPPYEVKESTIFYVDTMARPQKFYRLKKP